MKKIKLILYIFLFIINTNTIFSQLNTFQIQQKDRIENDIEYDYTVALEKSTYYPRFGLLFGYGLNFHHTDFKELPGYPTCCDNFRSGFGHGINFGGLVQIRINKDWYVGSQLFLSNLNGLIKHSGTYNITGIDGSLQIAKTEYKIDAAINTIMLSPYVAYAINKISEDFQVLAGLNFGFIPKANFTKYEELISPSWGVFKENGLRTRDNVTADLPDKNILFGIGIGIQYDLPLNKNKNWHITPEFKYNFELASPVKSLNWNISQFTLGVSIRYNKLPDMPIPADPLLPPLPPMRMPNMDSKFIADVNHNIKVLNSDGTYSDVDEIMVEEYTQSNLKPLLNYIFFETMSDVIPSRYKHLDTNQMYAEEYRNFSNMSAVETYHYLLDIVAFRLKKYPNATIELIGTNTGNGNEKNNLNLSERRANNVKKYLMDTWKIEDYRIKTTARNLPKDPTRPTEGSGDEENRRVEIISNDSRITEAILSFDTITVIKTPNVKFIPSVTSSFGVSDTKLTFKKNNIVLIEKSFDADLSPTYVEVTNAMINRNVNLPFIYQLTAIDKMGQEVSSEIKKINTNIMTIGSKKSGNYADTSYEYYSLILFEFNSASLGVRNNKVIDYIKTRINPSSKIIISGYTDIIGMPEANKRLATERATISAKRLGVPDVELRGIGTDELLYDNTYPEGRFYCRTVTIYIATPIIND